MRFPEIDTLFVHIPKTGGTTVTALIAKHLYPDELDGYNKVMKLYRNSERVVVKKKEKRAHVYAYHYRKALGKDVFNEQYKFAFIRNPFEQVRSLYKQLTYMNIEQNPIFKPYKTMTFEEFVLGEGKFSMEGNADLIDQEAYVKDRKREEVIVDDIYLFDYYKESLSILGSELGIYLNPKVVMRKTKAKDSLYSPEMATALMDQYGHVFEFYKKAKRNFEQYVLPKK